MTFRSQEQPLCRCCGKRIPKSTNTVWVDDFGRRDGHAVAPLFSKADCEHHTNQQVVAVRYNGDPGDKGRTIWWFKTWDGESYMNEFFCGGTCEDRFAYIMARAGRCTNLYNEAMARRRFRISEAS